MLYIQSHNYTSYHVHYTLIQYKTESNYCLYYVLYTLIYTLICYIYRSEDSIEVES